MADNNEYLLSSDAVVANIAAELEKSSASKRRRILEAVAVAALGAIPWVGGVIAAAATFRSDEANVHADDLRTQWLSEHQRRLIELQTTLDEIFRRFDTLGDGIDERLESPEYLSLVRQTFREWDEADTAEERQLLVHLITNSAGTRVVTDDIVRLFLDWIELYHEAHFAVIRTIFTSPGSTRLDIWTAVYGSPIPRDDSPEADLYKMLVRDLSTGGVIRQARESDAYGRFFKRKASHVKKGIGAATMKSAFDDVEQYVLTGLGHQFVHYTMNELVARLEDRSGGEQNRKVGL